MQHGAGQVEDAALRRLHQPRRATPRSVGTISATRRLPPAAAALGDAVAHRVEHEAAPVSLDQRGRSGPQHPIDRRQARTCACRSSSPSSRGDRFGEAQPRRVRNVRAARRRSSRRPADHGGAIAEAPQLGEAGGGALGRDAGEQPAGGLRVDQQRGQRVSGSAVGPRRPAQTDWRRAASWRAPLPSSASAPSSAGIASGSRRRIGTRRRAASRSGGPTGRNRSHRCRRWRRCARGSRGGGGRRLQHRRRSAPRLARAGAAPRISAARMTPVPSGLVRISRSPRSQPALAQQLCRPRSPGHRKAERQFGPLGAVPADQHGAGRLQHLGAALAACETDPARRSAGAPAAGWRSPARSRACRPSHRCRRAHGWPRSARTDTGRRPCARKKSTVCSSGGAPGNETSAASSGLSSPIVTALAGRRLAAAPWRGRARRPGPSRRSRRSASAPPLGSGHRRAIGVAAHPAPVDPVLEPPQPRGPEATNGPREATASRRRVPISARPRRCGTARFSRGRRGRGAGWRPAAGRRARHRRRPSRADAPRIVATSPAAKTRGSPGERRSHRSR